MPTAYVLDTNAIIYFCGAEPRAVAILMPLLSECTIIVPAIVVTELWSSTQTSASEMDAIRSFLATTLVMPLDESLARAAGELRRDYRLSVGDAVIAATALATGATLLTRNTRDFKRVPDLRVEAI